MADRNPSHLNKIEPPPLGLMRQPSKREQLFEGIAKGSVGAELGVFAGDFTEEICEICSPSRLFAVDLWSGTHTSGDVNGENYRTLNLDEIRVRKTAEWNGRPITIVPSRTDAWLWEQPVSSLDWVYLDSDHSYGHVAVELEAARHAVKPGGLIMGHDFHSHQFPGVVRAVREFAQRWSCEIIVTRDDKLPSYAVKNPGPVDTSSVKGIVLQVGIGARDTQLLNFAGPDIEQWARKFGWEYVAQTTNVAEPRHPIWSKLVSELSLLPKYNAIFTLDADVMLVDGSVSPSEAFQAPGIGMALSGQSSDSPHFNCGVRALRQPHALVEPMLTAAWQDHDRTCGHPWQEQAAIHELQLHFPDVVYPISPRWNYNFADRHLQGAVSPVLLSYHGMDKRFERMVLDQRLYANTLRK